MYVHHIATPFGGLRLHFDDQHLFELSFIDRPKASDQRSEHPLARAFEQRWQLYLQNPHSGFDTLPIRLNTGSEHDRRVWLAIKGIASAQTESYKTLATALASSPRAIGGACGRNPLPVIIPCHRVLTHSGHLGGFMQTPSGEPLAIKRWLLTHEGAAFKDKPHTQAAAG